jgi:hypothetical protein
MRDLPVSHVIPLFKPDALRIDHRRPAGIMHEYSNVPKNHGP